MEVHQTIQAANETLASGISGQSIGMYQLLFLEIPGEGKLYTSSKRTLQYTPETTDL